MNETINRISIDNAIKSLESNTKEEFSNILSDLYQERLEKKVWEVYSLIEDELRDKAKAYQKQHRRKKT